MERHTLLWCTGALLLAALGSAAAAASDDARTVQARFAKPSRDYATAPLWVWNDMLTEEQVVSTLRDLASQNVKQAFVHPRPGLMTPYLSDDWFRLWKAALTEAERLDMNLWIYDENSYPSGFAGGWVPELMPESRGRGLGIRADKQPPKWEEATLAVFRVNGNSFEPVSDAVRAGQSLPEGDYLTFRINRAGNSPWHGNRSYVDLLYPGVTEKFLEVTMKPYQKQIGRQFGKRVPGVFTDEPQITPAGGMPWTEDLPVQFKKRWGYDLLAHLPSLNRPIGDYKRVRHNYYQTLLSLFIERWAKPYYEYCDKRNLEFTGHYWEHEWPNTLITPDNMALSAWQHRPGIDILMNEYQEDTHAQFGNVRAVKEVASVANQLGRKRTLCEAYGAGGWDLRFEDMKRIGDWIYVLGINTMDEHLSYITLRGARKMDHPQSFSYHEPWWEAYHVSATYFTRLSAALSAGKQVNSILLIEPTTTAWLYNGGGADKNLGEIGASFQKLVVDLEKSQVEFDLGCEDVIARHGSVRGKSFVVGERRYSTVILPPHLENLDDATMDLLEKYARSGGTILAAGEAPSLVDGKASPRGAALAGRPGYTRLGVDEILQRLASALGDTAVVRSADSKGILYHHRRQLKDGELLFLVNSSITEPATGTVQTKRASAQVWDLRTGASRPATFNPGPSGITVSFALPPAGSLLLLLSDEKLAPAPASPLPTNLASATETAARRAGPNVLVLDYLDVTAGGETRKSSYFYAANQFAFQKAGLPRNPWDSAVQFRDELITQKFPADSGFEATYRFTVAKAVPKDLAIVVERPDLYTLALNGKPLTAAKDSWWLDKSFGRIDVAAIAQVGENTLTLKGRPFTIYHEIAPVFVLGDFSLEPTGSGFAVAPAQPLKLGKWNEQGAPFYAQGVTYAQEYDLSDVPATYSVALARWNGSVARVVVNGTLAGYIAAAPWDCDVTAHIKPGRNTVEVTVIGTLKNTLGPHHGNPPLGRAWPGMFHQGPKDGPPAGRAYHTAGYGLFEPFTLRRVTK